MHSQRRSISIRKYGQHLTFFERFHHVGYCLFLYPLYLRKSHDAPGLRNLFPAPKSGHYRRGHEVKVGIGSRALSDGRHFCRIRHTRRI